MALWIPKGVTIAGSNTTVNNNVFREESPVDLDIPGDWGIFNQMGKGWVSFFDPFVNPVYQGLVTATSERSTDKVILQEEGPTDVEDILSRNYGSYAVTNNDGSGQTVFARLDYSFVGWKANISHIALFFASFTGGVPYLYVYGWDGISQVKLATILPVDHDWVQLPVNSDSFIQNHYWDKISIEWPQYEADISHIRIATLEIYGRAVPTV